MSVEERLDRKVARLHRGETQTEADERLVEGLDAQDYLSLALLPLGARVRKHVTKALLRTSQRRDEREATRKRKRDEERDQEDDMAVVEVGLGKGASLTYRVSKSWLA